MVDGTREVELVKEGERFAQGSERDREWVNVGQDRKC